MTGEHDEVLSRIRNAMATVFRIPPGYRIGRATSAPDVEGWDSLSHSILIMKIEEEFGIDLPLDRIYGLSNVGELVDLIAETRTSG